MKLQVHSSLNARLASLLAITSLALVVASCGLEQSETVDTPSNTSAPVSVAMTDEDLSALGYVDFAEPSEGETKSGVVHFERDASAPGFNLYVSIPMATAALIDAAGNEVHRWQSDTAKRWMRCELLPNGDVLILGALENDSNRKIPEGFITRLTWDGEELWTRLIPAHHDLDWDSEGLILALTQERRELPNNPNWPAVLDNRIQRMDANGQLLESQSLTEVLNLQDDLLDLGIEASLESLPDEDAQVFEDVFAELEEWRATQPDDAENANSDSHPDQAVGSAETQAALANQTPLDLIHANTVCWISPKHETSPLFGTDVLVTMRHLDIVAAIDWSTGQERWRSKQGLLQGPHEANLLASGNLIIFDNGIRGRGFSRIVELDPRSDSIVWEWHADEPTDFYCRTRGTCQALPNGNVLIADSEQGAAFEITREGQIVWRFYSPITDDEGRRGAIRIRRYDTDFVEQLLQEHR